MSKKFMYPVAIVSALGAVALLAQEGTTKATEGALMLEKESYSLKHAVAYETTNDIEQAIAVVFSGQSVSSEKLKETREAEKARGDGDRKRQYRKHAIEGAG